jgi:hypothetical protein
VSVAAPLPLTARQGSVAPAATVLWLGGFECGAGEASEQAGERGLLPVVEVVGDVECEADKRQVRGHQEPL